MYIVNEGGKVTKGRAGNQEQHGRAGGQAERPKRNKRPQEAEDKGR